MLYIHYQPIFPKLTCEMIQSILIPYKSRQVGKSDENKKRKRQIVKNQNIFFLQINNYYFLYSELSLMGKTTKGKKVAKKVERKQNPLFEKRPRNFRIGGDIQPKRNLTRFVRWPKYVILQRQKRILLTRIKVPALIHQFSKTLDKNQTTNLFKLLKKYSPEDAKTKRARLVQQAKLKAENKTVQKSRPFTLKFGLNHVTKLIQQKKAKLVVIANNVDPIELVIWLPQLCRKMDVPFCFVKGKSALGQLVHQKTSAVVALTEIRKQDQNDLESYAKVYRSVYNENKDLLKTIGGNQLGFKSQIRANRIEKEKEKESLRKLKN